jgi:hypothetical protein
VEETAQGIVMELRGMFKSALDIQERFFFLDCRKSQSTEMISFRTFLAELKKKKLEVIQVSVYDTLITVQLVTFHGVDLYYMGS